MLRVEHISTSYGKKQVLFDVSLDVNQGDIVLLIGSNGSGKSTLLKSIYRLLPPFTPGVGEVYFNGENITECKSSSLIQKGLAYIPQKNNFFEDLTVKENLEVSGISMQNNLLFEDRYQSVLGLFPMLNEKLKRNVMHLSGGEKQLLALAMAVLHEPKMILMDEPFAGLSEKNINIVKNHVMELNKIFKFSFLIVEHRVKDSFLLANKVIALKFGKIFYESDVNLIQDIFELNSVFV